MRVDLILRKLLTATAEKTAAERRIARYRDRLDTEARRRFTAEGAAPTWKAPKLGNVRLDPKDARPYVDDPAAFASYVAERYPGEVTATIELDGDRLAAALEALDFAGVDVTRSALDVRQPFAGKLLDELIVQAAIGIDPAADPADTEISDVVRTALRVVDEETGEAEPVAGVKVHPPGATLVVTLDPEAKRRTIAEADAVVDTEEADERVEDEHTAEAHLGIPIAVDDTIPPDRVELRDGDRVLATITGLDRNPYVADDDPVTAALRSADVDREELDTLPTPSQPGYAEAAERRARLEASVTAWEAQAARHREAQLAADEAPLIDPSYPAAGRVRPPAPELSAEERAIVDRFEAAPNALTLDAEEVCLETGGEPLDAGAPGAPGTPEAIGDELDARYRTDDLKRIARRRKVSVSGTKAELARRLAAAGVTLAEAASIVDEARSA